MAGFGAKLVEDNKGIVRGVKLDKQELEDWTVYPLPLDAAALKRLAAGAPGNAGGDTASPGFWRGTLKIEHTKRIGLDDPYFKMLSTEWSKALRTAFMNIEALDI